MFSRPRPAGIVVKSGALYRQSGFLKRWKMDSFYLYQYGVLRCFGKHDDLDPKFEKEIKTGLASIRRDEKSNMDIQPPENIPRSCLFVLEFTDGDLTLCANNEADANEWIQAIEATKSGAVQGNPPMATASVPPMASSAIFGAPFNQGYPGRVIQPQGAAQAQTIQYPGGHQQIFVQAPQQFVFDAGYGGCCGGNRYHHRRCCHRNEGHTDYYF